MSEEIKREEEKETAPDGGMPLSLPLDKMAMPLLIALGLVGVILLFLLIF